jgi:hypothetical protein
MQIKYTMKKNTSWSSHTFYFGMKKILVQSYLVDSDEHN